MTQPATLGTTTVMGVDWSYGEDWSVEVHGHYDKNGNVVIDSIERLAITKEIEQRRARIARRLER